MRENLAKRKVAEGGVALGSFVKCCDASVPEIFGACGFDFFVLDNEHVAMDALEMTNMMRAADAAGITPVVRVPVNSPIEILHALDAGTLGVQVPNVDTAEQAAAVVAAAKYGPIGTRGFSPSVRAAGFGSMDIKEYIHMANRETWTIAHCETTTCVENLDRILCVPDLDVIFIGPMDLSQSMGLTGETKHPDVVKTIDAVIAKVRSCGKAPGIVAGSAAQALEYIEKGVQYILYSSDFGMVYGTGKQFVKDARKR